MLISDLYRELVHWLTVSEYPALAQRITGPYGTSSITTQCDPDNSVMFTYNWTYPAVHSGHALCVTRCVGIHLNPSAVSVRLSVAMQLRAATSKRRELAARYLFVGRKEESDLCHDEVPVIQQDILNHLTDKIIVQDSELGHQFLKSLNLK